MAVQPVAGRQGLGIGHVQRRPARAAVAQCGAQGIGIDKRAVARCLWPLRVSALQGQSARSHQGAVVLRRVHPAAEHVAVVALQRMGP